jgi:protein ImuB
MQLWISLYLPTHSLDALFPNWSAEAPQAAVLRQGRVCACTPAALALGLRPGMRRGSALGLAPGIILREEDPQAEDACLRQLALAMLQYTPRLAYFDAHTLVLDVGASLRLFGGPRALGRRLAASLAALQARARLGMAPTAAGACMLAWRAGTGVRRRTLCTDTLRRLLDELPAASLPAGETHAAWFDDIGCSTLGQLRCLPRKGLQRRSAPAVVRSLDAAYGDADEHFVWFEAPPRFAQRHDFIERIEHVAGLRHAAVRLIELLCGWLQARHGATDRLDFLLHHEKGRHARPPTALGLAFSQAAWQAGDFLAVLDERLRGMSLEAPAIALELSVDRIEARPGQSQGLFIEPTQWASREGRLLDVLRARLGPQGLWQPRPRADHRPEHANLWEPLTPDSYPGRGAAQPQEEADAPTVDAAGASDTPDGQAAGRFPGTDRPFWLLRAAIPLETRNDRPCYQGAALRLVRGPERIEAGWWDDAGHVSRDYFVAQDASAARYWIYLDHKPGQPRWFLHGLFA